MKAKLGMMVGAVAAGILVLGGCSAQPADGGSGDADPGAVRIGFVPGITSDPFFVAMQIGAEEEAERLGVDLVWQGSGEAYTPEKQIPFVDALIADGVDALIISPTNAEGLQPSVAKAIAAGIPVITVDTTVADQSDLISHITGDNVDGGRRAANELADQVGGEGKVFLQMSSPTDTTNVLREEGFMEALAEYPDIELVGVQYHNSQAAAATSAINTVLLEHPDLAGIFAVNGTGVTGAVAALRAANRAGEVKLVGYDAYPEEMKALEDGVVTALIAQRPGESAALALQYAYAAVTGEGADSIEKNVTIENVVITLENIAETGKYEYAE